MHKRTYSLVALAVLIGGSTFTYARMGTNDSRLIPYSGTLRADGVAANGVYDIRFGLFATDPGAAPACLNSNPTTCSPWGEEQQVRVSAGSFAVALGEANAIIDSDISSNAMYLAMAVKGPNDVDYSHIGNHEIIPVPWAARAATSTNYEVTGNLTLGGVIEMGDRIDFHAGFNGDYDARIHATGANTLQIAGANVTVVPGAGGGNTGALSTAGNISSGGNISATGDVASGSVTATGTVSGGAVSTSGDLVANNNTFGGCSSHETDIPTVRYNQDDVVGALLTQCPDGKFMTGVYMQHYQEDSNFRDRYVAHIRCCEL
jgi:hypothetical protein